MNYTDSDILATFKLVSTTNVYVNVGGALITCRDIPVSQAQAALDAYAKYLSAKRDVMTDALALDVTGVNGVRTVIAFAKITMLRGGGVK